MSINSTRLIVIISSIVISSCFGQDKSQLIKEVGRFENLTQFQLDSVANNFDELANYMSQPSDKHRLYKDSACSLAPTNEEYCAQLSYSYKKRGDHLKAMKILNDAVQNHLKKGSYELLEYRAWTLLYFYRNYLGTIADVDLVNKMSKSAYNICWGEPCGLLKGQALYKIGKYNEALNVFDTVLIEETKRGFKADNNFLVHFYRGRCYHELSLYDKALSCYELVLGQDKNYTEALFQIGLIYKMTNQKEKSDQYFEKAIYWLKKGKKMGEPYFERFDEAFQINAARE
jgi:tetratricopeptide (TPR) repeat protein